MSRPGTPLRYPGGKQKLTPFIAEILAENDLVGGHYVEPYAGGAGVAIELLLSGYVNNIHLNDSALPVYAFWNSVITQPESLCRMIASASLTVDEWKYRREIVRAPEGHSELEVGFSTLYLNRCNRSGVLTGGLIGGLSQTGKWLMDARFPRNELIRRVEVIAARAESITIHRQDAEDFVKGYVSDLPIDTFVYCDPPYFEKSNRLYLNHYRPDDHRRIAEVIQTELSRPWIVSYDNAPEILEFYKVRRSFTYNLQYNASRAYQGREIFVFSDDVHIPRESALANIKYGIVSAVPALSESD
ncbi:MAG TPA: DNA adenine methylase [Longimicrobium sp.]|jgi:DNA adenine methylase